MLKDWEALGILDESKIGRKLFFEDGGDNLKILKSNNNSGFFKGTAKLENFGFSKNKTGNSAVSANMANLADRQHRASLKGMEALKEFKRVNREECRGGVFFAVSRGKLSEGLDFSDNDARCVIIVGIPFRNLADPGVKIKIDHLNDIC